MKILHTSDWHIGRKLYNKEFEEEHQLFFDWLIEKINQEKIDILIVAGDIFDIAYPSNSSLKLYYKTLTRLQSTSCKHIFITGGNHDAVSTLNAPQKILEYLNITVIGGATEKPEDLIFEIKNPEENIELVVCAIPFLRDKDIRKSVAGEIYEDRRKAISDGIAGFYQTISELTLKYSQKNIPVIATGHLFVNDANMSSDEKDLYIGGLQQLSFKKFPQNFDYIALGHIHRPQKIGNLENIRYSGSPISLSFSEINQQKSVVMVETANNKIDIKTVDVPKFRNIIRFKGQFNEIITKIKNYSDENQLKTWAEIVVEEENYNPELIRKFEDFISDIKNIEVLNPKIIFKDNIYSSENMTDNTKSLNEMTEIEIFDNLLENLQVDNKNELKNTFTELLNYVER